MGIGEVRYALVEDGEIIEARIAPEGTVTAGTVLHAQLIEVGHSGRNAVAVAEGEEYLLPEGAPGVTVGATFPIVVTREKIPGAEQWKRPLARPTAVNFVGNQSDERTVAMPDRDRLGEFGWEDLLDEAREAIVPFVGGELRVSVTPAMTLIDVDGAISPGELAMAGARAAARAIRRHGIGGSIGIDLPTVKGRSERNALGEAIDAILPKPFERTAVNGFGFLQIVRPRRHASMFELAADRAPFEARALLRRAGRETGALRLAAHPKVIAVIESHSDWIALLARQVGGAVGLRADALLPISAGHAEPA
ncbi:ribonuclease [Sphingomonas sp.]|uniref:ribonuclease n=1 Tax=Sphingomonas sp. TaxID=28214 RepID=UPI0025DCF605|nr:ribonuclease [Sphingomonas sp.]